VTYLLDTDHISVLQRQSGPEFAMLLAHIAQDGPTELAFSIISMHEQVLEFTRISVAPALPARWQTWPRPTLLVKSRPLISKAVGGACHQKYVRGLSCFQMSSISPLLCVLLT
jgi:hypothetical protein